MTDDPQESRNPEREQEFAALLDIPAGRELVDRLGVREQQLEVLTNPAGMGRIDSVAIVQVVLVRGIRGTGTTDDPVRTAVQWWTTTGQLIAMAEAPAQSPVQTHG